MIKVLHVFGVLNYGGAESMMMNLYRKIDRTKIQFDFVVHGNESGNFADEIEKLGGVIYHCPKYKVTNTIKYSNWWGNFFSSHKEYTIIHSHVRSTASVYIPIAKSYGLKTIVHSHSTSNGKGMASILKKIMQYPLRYQADYLFSCSEIAGKWLFGKKALSKSNYRQIPNAVDTIKFQYDDDQRRQRRADLGIMDSTIVFGHVGRFHPAKNHMFLLDVFSAIHNFNPNSLLLLVGDGELRSSIENRISELGLSDCVMLLGVQRDIPRLLQAFDVFLFPSKWEGLPVTVIEAQASGIPCFVSNTITRDVGITELVEYLPIDKGTDIWVRLLQNKKFDRKDVSAQIREAGFDINETAKLLTDFYTNLALHK